MKTVDIEVCGLSRVTGTCCCSDVSVNAVNTTNSIHLYLVWGRKKKQIKPKHVFIIWLNKPIKVYEVYNGAVLRNQRVHARKRAAVALSIVQTTTGYSFSSHVSLTKAPASLSSRPEEWWWFYSQCLDRETGQTEAGIRHMDASRRPASIKITIPQSETSWRSTKWLIYFNHLNWIKV